MFKDRIDAGTQLAKELLKFKDEKIAVVAIPRGGLPIGAIVAKALHAPLDIALTKKIGHPNNKEYAIGALSLEEIILTNAKGVTKEYIIEETKRVREKLQQRHNQYYKKRSPQNIRNKTVIIIDDGIATGNTLLATIELISKKHPKKIIVGIPVAPNSAIKKLENTSKVDEVICLHVPYNFQAVGQFYERFDQVTDEEAIRILDEFKG